MGANNAKRIEVPDDLCSYIDATRLDDFLQQICQKFETAIGSVANQTMTFGKAGTVGSKEYLYAEEIETNKSGRPVHFDGVMEVLSLNNRKSSGDKTIEVRKRSPAQSGSWITIATLTVPGGEKYKTFPLAISLLKDDEIAIRVKNGSNDFEDIIISAIIRKTITL